MLESLEQDCQLLPGTSSDAGKAPGAALDTEVERGDGCGKMDSHLHPSFCWCNQCHSCLPHTHREVRTSGTGREQPQQWEDWVVLLVAAFGLKCSLRNIFNRHVLRSPLHLTAATAQLHLTGMWWPWVYHSSDGAEIGAPSYLEIWVLKAQTHLSG